MCVELPAATLQLQSGVARRTEHTCLYRRAERGAHTHTPPAALYGAGRCMGEDTHTTVRYADVADVYQRDVT